MWDDYINSNMNYDDIAFLAQSKLKDLGFYAGKLDGMWGPASTSSLSRWKSSLTPPMSDVTLLPVLTQTLDSRTIAVIATLDLKAQPKIRDFMLQAVAIAASFGCEYKLISGYRTWEQQAALYKACQNGGPHAVPAGYSMHNYKCAVDAGVFRNGVYLDGGTNAEQALASKVHLACSKIAPKCGLISGATWAGKSNDQPHYQIDIGHATPTDADRARFKSTGSIL